MGAKKGPACPQPGHPGRKRRVHRRPGCGPGPSQLTRGLRLPTGPQGGDMGGDSTCHSREAPWLLPTLLQAPHTPTRAPHCPALPRTGLGRQGQRGGAVRPPTTLGASPHTPGPGGTLPMPVHPQRPVSPCPSLQAPPPPGRVPASPFRAAPPTLQSKPDGPDTSEPRAERAPAGRPSLCEPSSILRERN